MADTTYSADQIINKTLIGLTPVDVKLFPLDSKPIHHTIQPGLPVGVVWSWVQDTNGNVWWMFYDTFGNPFYVKHKVGEFSIQSLQDQGAVTVKEATAAAAAANMSTIDKIGALAKTYLPWLIGGYIVVKVVVPLVTKKND